MTKPATSIKTILKSLSFFSALNDDEIELLSSFSTLSNYPKDYILHYEKEMSNSLIFLVSGQAKAYKIDKHDNEIYLYHIDKDSLISDISNIKSDTIYALSNLMLIEDSQVLYVDFKKFKSYFLDKNYLQMEFLNEIIKKTNQLHDLINREFIFDSVAKVAMLLDSDLDMFNKLKRSEVSTMLHIQPETLSRVLNRLKRNQIVDSKSGKIHILDKDALRAIFEG